MALFPFRNPMTEATECFRGNRHAHVHLVRQEMPFENLALLLPSQGMKNLPELTPHFPKQDLPPALRDEDHMVFAVPLRVGSALIKVRHDILLFGWFSPSHLEEGCYS